MRPEEDSRAPQDQLRPQETLHPRERLHPQETLRPREVLSPDEILPPQTSTALVHVERGSLLPATSSTMPLFEPVVQGRRRLLLLGFLFLWLVSVVSFWTWWLQPSHEVTLARTVFDSLLIGYFTVIMPGPMILYLARLRRVNPNRPIPVARVAFVVTKAPSEPWSMVKTTLNAMRHQVYPYAYDVWLCDENPTDETKEWCGRHGVSLSSRYGVPEYQRLTWPRREKCKEGNLSYFYDHWGYENYDLVSQLDADHVPSPTYLAEMMRPFGAANVGYVAAPSVCDANAATSWVARGRLYREAAFHGPTQAGCNEGWAPFCIGSHYAVRTKALSDIGGIGPELAEDFTTSLLLTSAGWEGAFALDAEAHGEGPPTFAAFRQQETQWSQSLSTVLFDLFWRKVWALPWPHRGRFLLGLFYYPLLMLGVCGSLVMIEVAVLTGRPWMKVNYFDFILRMGLISAPLVLAMLLLRRRGILRPVDTKLISWELWLFSFARWPYVAWGVLVALKLRLFPVQTTYKVTPKGNQRLAAFPLRFVLPYLAISAMECVAALARSGNIRIHGYVLLSLLEAATYLLVAGAIVALHVRETRRASDTAWSALLPTISSSIFAVGSVALLFGAATSSVFNF